MEIADVTNEKAHQLFDKMEADLIAAGKKPKLYEALEYIRDSAEMTVEEKLVLTARLATSR